MESKPVYKIRKNGKQDVFEGTLDDVRKWLRQNSINSADEMRRSGYAVLELDEFWGLVSDFPELSMTERQGRGVLLSKIKAAKRTMAVAVLLALGAIALYAYIYLLPSYSESLDRSALLAKIEEAKSSGARAIEQLKKEHAQDIEARQVAVSDAENKAKQGKDEAGRQLAKAQQEKDQVEAKLSAVTSRANQAEDRLREGLIEIQNLKQANQLLQERLAKLAEHKGRMPVTAVVEKRNVLPGYKLYLWNVSPDVSRVRVVVKYPGGERTTDNIVSIDACSGSKPMVHVFDDVLDAGAEVTIKYLSEEGTVDLNLVAE